MSPTSRSQRGAVSPRVSGQSVVPWQPRLRTHAHRKSDSLWRFYTAQLRQYNMVGLALGLCFAGQVITVQAQRLASPPPVIGSIDADTKSQLVQVDELAKGGRWADAGQKLAALASAVPYQLVLSDGDRSGHSVHVPLLDFSHRWIGRAAISGEREPLDRYRFTQDQAAEDEYRRGGELLDPLILERMTRQSLLAQHGDDGLVALGELALLRGEYGRAREAWEKVHPQLRTTTSVPGGRWGRSWWWTLGNRLPSEVAPWMNHQEISEPTAHGRKHISSAGLAAYPDSPLPIDELRARLALTSILEGDLERARWEIDCLRLTSPSARFVLAGKEDLAITHLESVYRNVAETGTNSTTGKCAGQNGTERGGSLWDLPLRPDWSIALPTSLLIKPDLSANRQLPHRSGTPPGIQPVVADDWLILHDGRTVFVYRTDTGAPAWPGAERGVNLGAPRSNEPNGNWQPTDSLYYPTPRTGTVDRSQYFALMDRLEPGNHSRPAMPLMGIDLHSQGRLLPSFPLLPLAEEEWFSGPPLVRGDSIYAIVRGSGLRHEVAVVAYDFTTGILRWRIPVIVADSQLNRPTGGDLLNWYERRLYLCTHAGATVAIDAESGRIEWLARYPRRIQPAPDLSPAGIPIPCLVERGLVIAAPADTDQVFAWDAATGELLWETFLPPSMLEGVQLLGTHRWHLIGAGQQLWWLDLHTGRPSRQVASSPFPSQRLSLPRGQVRGTLVENCIVWPVRGDFAELHFMNATTGAPIRSPFPLEVAGVPAGNVMVAGNRLFVVTTENVHKFTIVDGL